MSLRIKDIVICVVAIIGLALIGYSGSKLVKRADFYVRDRVVKLHSEMGSCTGETIQSPSGKTYTLTAGHCRVLIQNGTVMAEDEQGRDSVLHFVAESPSADLILLEGGYPAMPGLEIAPSVSRNQHVHTITRGAGAQSYRTDGDVVDTVFIQLPESQIQSQADVDACVGIKHVPAQTMFGAVCVLQETVMRSTAKVVPGSSGGPVLDSQGRLVGVVSATDGDFGYMVPLSDIQAFLTGY